MRGQDFRQYGVAPGQSTLERYRLLADAREADALPQRVRLRCVDRHLPGGVGDIARVPGVGDLRDAPGGASSPAGAGTRAGDLVERLTTPPTPPRIDWRRALRELVQRMRVLSPCYTRPPRRFPERVGIVPGRVRRTVAGEKPHVVAAIDTSGSMSPGDLGAIAVELQALAPLARLTIAECDVEIQRVYAFEGELPAVRGRGGTDLRPVFAPDFLRQHRPNAIVYFTDGDGPVPEHPPGPHTLWVLTRECDFACTWGARAVLAV